MNAIISSQRSDAIDLGYLLSSRNVNCDLYDCDIERWLGVKLSDKKHDEIKSELRKMAGIKSWER